VAPLPPKNDCQDATSEASSRRIGRVVADDHSGPALVGFGAADRL
jgi:hypothetical protein